ncbi:MAG: hypothetical protein AAB870_05330 [Patescibacteria group bacterium]
MGRLNVRDEEEVLAPLTMLGSEVSETTKKTLEDVSKKFQDLEEDNCSISVINDVLDDIQNKGVVETKMVSIALSLAEGLPAMQKIKERCLKLSAKKAACLKSIVTLYKQGKLLKDPFVESYIKKLKECDASLEMIANKEWGGESLPAGWDYVAYKVDLPQQWLEAIPDYWKYT